MPYVKSDDRDEVTLIFGHGDICVAPGLQKGQPRMDNMLFFLDEPHEVGTWRHDKAGESNETLDTKVRMIFENVESLDVVIERFQHLRNRMAETQEQTTTL